MGVFGSVGPNVPEATKRVIRSVRLLWKISNPLFELIKLQMRIMASMAKRTPEKLPNSELKVISNAGHLWILDHMKDVMETLVPCS